MTDTRSVPPIGKRFAVALAVASLSLVTTLTVGAPARAANPVSEARSAVADADARLSAAQSELADAQTAVENAQARAQQAADRLAEAEARHAELTDAIVQLEADIDRTSAEIADLRVIVQERAVAAYQGSDPSPLAMFDTDDVVDAARRAELLSSAKRSEDETISQLGELEARLQTSQDQVESDRAEMGDVLDALAAERAAIDEELSGTFGLLATAESEFAARSEELAAANAVLEDAEEEARRAAEEAARREAEQAARRAAEAARREADSSAPPDDDSEDSTPSRPATTTTTEPEDDGSSTTSSDRSSDDDSTAGGGGSGGGSSMICPIDGPVAFADTWGDPRPGGRSHEGVDIFSPSGTPNVAVVDGYVSHGIGERQGNGVFLTGDDGNSYWYFHLASFATGAERVEQGDVIGYTGDTGNAAPGSYHTHFEIHPGYGAPVNPYPLTAAACF